MSIFSKHAHCLPGTLFWGFLRKITVFPGRPLNDRFASRSGDARSGGLSVVIYTGFVTGVITWCSVLVRATLVTINSSSRVGLEFLLQSCSEVTQVQLRRWHPHHLQISRRSKAVPLASNSILIPYIDYLVKSSAFGQQC